MDKWALYVEDRPSEGLHAGSRTDFGALNHKLYSGNPPIGRAWPSSPGSGRTQWRTGQQCQHRPRSAGGRKGAQTSTAQAGG